MSEYKKITKTFSYKRLKRERDILFNNLKEIEKEIKERKKELVDKVELIKETANTYVFKNPETGQMIVAEKFANHYKERKIWEYTGKKKGQIIYSNYRGSIYDVKLGLMGGMF